MIIWMHYKGTLYFLQGSITTMEYCKWKSCACSKSLMLSVLFIGTQLLITSDHNHNELLSYNLNRFCWIEVERWKEEGKDMKKMHCCMFVKGLFTQKIFSFSLYVFKIISFCVCVFHRWKTEIQFWNNMIKWCQNFNFAVKYPFNLIYTQAA